MVLEGYTCGVGGKEMVDQPLFVDQVCSLIACELMWGYVGVEGEREWQEGYVGVGEGRREGVARG